MDPWNSLGKVNISYEELIGYLEEDVFANIPEWNKYPNIALNKDYLVELFHLRYDCRQLGYATTRKFISRMRYLFAEWGPSFDLAYEKYLADKDNIRKVGKVIRRDHSEDGTSSIDSTSNTNESNTSNYYDTPKTSIPNPLANPSNATTAGGVSTETANTAGKTSLTRKETETDSQDTYLIELNKIIDSMRSLDTEFIDKFEELFVCIQVLE